MAKESKGKKELLFSLTKKDFDVEYIASTSGGGGQHRNRSHTACRITHRESGAVGFSADERSQTQNKRLAFQRLVESKKFKTWHRLKVAVVEKGLRDIEEYVDKVMMSSENLKIEYYDPNPDQENDDE